MSALKRVVNAVESGERIYGKHTHTYVRIWLLALDSIGWNKFSSQNGYLWAK